MHAYGALASVTSTMRALASVTSTMRAGFSAA